jgi:hypothetical protein
VKRALEKIMALSAACTMSSCPKMPFKMKEDQRGLISAYLSALKKTPGSARRFSLQMLDNYFLTEMERLAQLPAASVALVLRVWEPLLTYLVFQL